MIELLLAQLKQLFASQSNQFLTGGLTLGVIGSIGYYLKALPHKLANWFLWHFTVVVDVLSVDQAYSWVLTWLEKQPYTERARRISVRDVRDARGNDQATFVPARGNHWFFYHGMPVWLTRGHDDSVPAQPGMAAATMQAPRESIKIRTVGRNRKRINSIIAEARAAYEKSTKDRLVIKFRRWGDWEMTTRLKRPLESVFLPDNAMRVVTDAQRFITLEQWYRDMGVPYRRGYLFYGLAGTGKTTFAEALAGALSIELYSMNLNSVAGDGQLEQAISEMHHDKPVMLLIEDIDTVFTSASREEDKPVVGTTAPQTNKIALGTLLNVIDGLAASDKIILVMTTNYPDKLDPALKRKGRIDIEVEFTYATEEQIHAAVRKFIGEPTAEQQTVIANWPRPLIMAEIQEMLKLMVLANNPMEQAEQTLAA